MVNRITLPLADWVGVASLASAGDAQLLHRFAKAGEQQAFAMLVKRHGPMVWGVTRRLLRSHQDAEDAFQATFLVLAKKAGSLRQPQLLANWLHGVAHRTALQLRSRRKKLVPLEAEHEPADDNPDHVAWRECGMVIDRAIEELPSSLRIVFLLCQAEGLTTLATSKRLNLPEGTVVSRLHRARKQLQGLLARHGITSAAGAVTLGWSLALPEALSALTVRTLLATTPSALVAGLAQGVLTTMMWIKLTTAAVVVSTVGLVGAGAATFIVQGKGDKVGIQTALAQPPDKAEAKDELLKNKMRNLEQINRALMEAKDGLEQANAKVNQLTAIERKLRDELEAERQKNKAIQQFLQNNLQAQDAGTKNKQKAETDAREAELMMKREAERLEQVRVAQEKMERRKMEQQERRTANLIEARDQLTAEIKEMQKEYAKMEKEYALVQAEQQQFEQKLDIIKQDLEKEFRQAEKHFGVESEKMKELKAKRDALVAESARRGAGGVQSKSASLSIARLQSQMQLREKLLLEVEEKLLRMQLKLDEK
ncbi:MAG: sigma-70 family RNA polymerase sigma factor [Gemmatales bacterium]